MRRAHLLNGDWDFAPDYAGLEPAAALVAARGEAQKVSVPSSWRWSIAPEQDFQPYDLFGYPMEWNKAQSGILRRTFMVDPAHSGSAAGSRVVLVFKGILQRWAIFVNGALIAEGEESFLPVEIDVTEKVHPGRNDLAVWCGPFSSRDTPAGRKLLSPNGSWFAQLARGLWQDVLLEYRPAISIEDACIRTSVRNGRIDIEVSIRNASALPASGTIGFEIFDGEARVMAWEAGSVVAAAGNSATLCTHRPWADPVLWLPEDPHLYMLRVTWEGAGGRDSRSFRFGFREVWLDGHRFFLNGVPVFLRGDAWHYQGFVMQSAEYARAWYRMCRNTGINVVRLHAMPYPECFLHAADEMGMLIIDESAIYGSSKITQSDDPAFIERCRGHLRGLVRRDRNRPSVVIWSMQNEMRWVDGRDGWRDAMPGLVSAMRELDSTRPISFDGDNRLVDPRDAEILSMHYTIDGTVAQWTREKPLVFGEHGAWHYASPQTCAGFAGQKAFTDFRACMDAIGLQEKLFIEYARRAEVTGITPFNIVNYSMEAMPSRSVAVQQASVGEKGGPHPHCIPAWSLTLNDGRLPDQPLFKPNPSWHHVRDAFAPVAVIPNEYDRSFFGGEELRRSFSIYNDTMHAADVTIAWRLTDAGGALLDQGDACFSQPPGSRRDWDRTFLLPHVREKTQIMLRLDLLHRSAPMRTLVQEYSLFSRDLLMRPVASGARAGFTGRQSDCTRISLLLPGIRQVSRIDAAAISGLQLLIMGPGFEGDPGMHQPVLRDFVSRGGFLLVLEQSRFTPGEFPLTAQSFFRAFMTDPGHPVFAGLTDTDLDAWHPGNPWDPKTPGITRHLFRKPSRGDAHLLLECGEGDFGWGGLLWSPMVEVAVGKGRVLLNQMELMTNMDQVPPAAMLLRNLLAWGCSPRAVNRRPASLRTRAGSTFAAFLDDAGVTPAFPELEAPGELVIAEPDALDPAACASLRDSMNSGAEVLVIAAEPRHEPLLENLAGATVRVVEAPTYQVAAQPDPSTRGISQSDLSLIDKVTYSPPTQSNTVIARCAVEAAHAIPLFAGVIAPWVDFFIKGLDAEYQKTSVATMALDSPAAPRCYGVRIPVGKGALLLSQVLLLAGNEKVRRFYGRFLSNLGVPFTTSFLDCLPDESDYGLDSVMAIAGESHQDQRAMREYFTNPLFVLNNLGEGVFGWMKRIDAQDGVIIVPGSSGKNWFLTAFIESEINRDPSMRSSRELPDPSIVPDLYVRSSSPVEVFINGRRLLDLRKPAADAVKIEDAVLCRGVNRLALICTGGAVDVKISTWFLTKRGEQVPGLRSFLTLD
jgi:beta-galactosidase